MNNERQKRYINDKYQDVYERISEELDREYGDSIRDRDSFLTRYRDYMKNTNIRDDEKFINKSFEEYTRNTAISPSRRRNVVHNTIEKEKQNQMEEIRSGKKRYKRTAQPNRIITKKKGKKSRIRTFTVLASRKGKTVYARKIKTKKGYRYVTKEGFRVKKI